MPHRTQAGQPRRRIPLKLRYDPRLMTRCTSDTQHTQIAWAVSAGLVDYTTAVVSMEARARAIASGTASECVWLLEHPPLYTAGTSAKAADLVDPARFPVHTTGRGGQYTYHGPGQRIAYVMLDVKARGGDVRVFVQQLEGWLIATLAQFGVSGFIRPGRVGVWTERLGIDGVIYDEKIAALGIRVVRGVSFHGVSLNVDCDLSHFSGIVPCGLAAYGVTSLAALGRRVPMADVDAALRISFETVFAPTVDERNFALLKKQKSPAT
jgi:lipoyl(octanoyl) transferase